MNSLSVQSVNGTRNHRSIFKSNDKNYMAKPTNNVPQPPAQNASSMSKTIPIVSSVVALASLGVATYAVAKKPGGFKNIEKQLETITKDVAESKKTQEVVEESVKTISETVNTVKNNVERTVNEIKGEVGGFKKELDAVKGEIGGVKGEIGGVRGEIGGVRNEIGGVKNDVGNVRGEVNALSGAAPRAINMLTRSVEVNGQRYNLATVMHGYGVHEESLTNQLRAESTRRVLGAVKPNPLAEELTVRVPSAEFQGFTKTGGLAVVPRELIGNLGAVINNKQKVKLYADTPLYLGQVENNQFFRIVKDADGKFSYLNNKGGKESVMTRLTKIDEMHLPIYTDVGKTTERVEVFVSDELHQAVPYEEVLRQFEPETAKKIEEAMALGKDFDASVVHFIAPKPSSAKFSIGGEKPVSIDYNKFIESIGGDKAREIKESLEIGKEFKISMIDVIQAKGGNRQEALESFGEEAVQSLNKALDSGRPIEITFTPPAPAEAEVRFNAVFYKNDKFRMDGPVQGDKIKNIYNDQTTQAGETERNVYFCKYMYENIANNHESADLHIGADWIVGNDWHTGPLSAMMRLLTPARKAMGMEPAAADKLYNTTTTTLMHNFKLQGSVWHSQPKLLNVMFGEHAAKITENAWMPQKADMPNHLMNGMFSGNAINPQTMAMSYADDIVFVSRGNFNEAASISEKGGTNYALASLRGRTWQYAERRKLDEIAMASGIRPDEVGAHPTAKGITNGCDRVNNIITKKRARKLEEDLRLPIGSLKSEEEAILNPFAVHQHNKGVYLRERVSKDIEIAKATGGKENPMKLYDWEHTSLEGVDENTIVHGMAGRIVDQKGIDNWSAGIVKFYERGNYDKANPPVYYLQGVGDAHFINGFLAAKNRVREIDPKAADRMVCAGLFSEPGRYDGCKMMSDFSGMPSWDEPCGLVHKEIGYNSGAISIVNKVGGLTDGLKGYVRGGENRGANSIFVDFMDKDTHSYEDAIRHNSEKWADAFETAQAWFNNKQEFAAGIESSYKSRHDWLQGKVQEYIEIGKRHGIIAENVDSHYVL